MAAALSLAALAVLVPSPGQAWWRGGVFIGIPPIVVPPVGYPPPPIYSAPPLDYEAPPGYEGGPEAYRSPPAAGQQPPAGYAPPPAGVPETAKPSGRQAGTLGYSCFAGAYVCPLDRSLPVGRLRSEQRRAGTRPARAASAGFGKPGRRRSRWFAGLQRRRDWR